MSLPGHVADQENPRLENDGGLMQLSQWLVIAQIVFGAAGVALFGAAWRMFTWAKRMDDMTRDFPPHHHINGKISYPKGYEPPLVEQLHG